MWKRRVMCQLAGRWCPRIEESGCSTDEKRDGVARRGRYSRHNWARSGLDMETDQEEREIVEDPREWYWSRIECEETAVVDSVPGGFLLWSAQVWRNFARSI